MTSNLIQPSPQSHSIQSWNTYKTAIFLTTTEWLEVFNLKIDPFLLIKYILAPTVIIIYFIYISILSFIYKFCHNYFLTNFISEDILTACLLSIALIIPVCDIAATFTRMLSPIPRFSHTATWSALSIGAHATFCVRILPSTVMGIMFMWAPLWVVLPKIHITQTMALVCTAIIALGASLHIIHWIQQYRSLSRPYTASHSNWARLFIAYVALTAAGIWIGTLVAPYIRMFVQSYIFNTNTPIAEVLTQPPLVQALLSANQAICLIAAFVCIVGLGILVCILWHEMRTHQQLAMHEIILDRGSHPKLSQLLFPICGSAYLYQTLSTRTYWLMTAIAAVLLGAAPALHSPLHEAALQLSFPLADVPCILLLTGLTTAITQCIRISIREARARYRFAYENGISIHTILCKVIVIMIIECASFFMITAALAWLCEIPTPQTLCCLFAPILALLIADALFANKPSCAGTELRIALIQTVVAFAMLGLTFTIPFAGLGAFAVAILITFFMWKRRITCLI